MHGGPHHAQEDTLRHRRQVIERRRRRTQMTSRHYLGALLAAVLLGLPTRPSAAPMPSRLLPSYVLLGLDTINMKEFAFTNLGNVGVNNAGGTMAWGGESFFNDGSQVVADVVRRAGSNSSLYDVFTNTFVSPLANVTIRHDGPVPWAPLPLITPLPPTPSCAPGAAPVRVIKSGSLALAPGAYGRVKVLNGATLELTGGTYCFADVKLGRKSSIVVDAPVNVTITGKYRSNPGSRLVAAMGSGIGATDIVFGVAGKLVKFSHRNKIFGVFYAPNAMMRFGRGGFFTGQFVARAMGSDFSDTFTLEVCGNGVIDPGEACDGGACCTAECEFVSAGTPCPDGNLCNGDETCSAFGQCIPGTPLVCNDGNVCTTDSCIPATGCHVVDKPDGTSCSDGKFCNGAEICVGGTCTDQPDPTCDDGMACTTDSCNPARNACDHVPVDHPVPGCECPNGDSDCDNDDVCDGTETCDASHEFCLPGVPLECSTSNQCQDPICDPQTGCGTEPKPDGTPCDDDDVCSVDDQCTGGTCGGMVEGCDDGDPCTADSCDSQTGCAHTPIPGCGQGTICTLTQGAYGGSGGIANGGQGWITNNPGVLPKSIGAPGTGRSVTVTTQAGLIAFLPTGGTAAALSAANGDVVINGPGDVPDPSGSGSLGDGAGVLAGQALSLKLSVALSNLGANPPGLGNTVLQPAFCTCDGNGGRLGPFVISACILDNAVTVNNLIGLADQALRGASLAGTDPCLTYADISNALDAINRGFDECRSVCACTP
jgi:hypothetical protein